MIRVKFPCWVFTMMGLTYKDAMKVLLDTAIAFLLIAFIGAVFPWLARIPLIGLLFNTYVMIIFSVMILIADFILYIVYLMRGDGDDDVIGI